MALITGTKTNGKNIIGFNTIGKPKVTGSLIPNNPGIIATLPIGYADGVPRALSNKIYGILNGRKVPQVGNITMDQMMFDITGVNAELGDIITLLDEENSIDNWAEMLGTINYELTCRLKVRLPRVYTR